MFLDTLKWISDSNVPRFVDIISTATTIIVVIVIIIMQLMWFKALPVHRDYYYYAICIFFPLAAFKDSAIKYSHKFWDNGVV